MTKNDDRELGSGPSNESAGPDQQPSESYRPIPVAVAKHLAEGFAKNWVVILAGDEAHGKLHTVTYGRSPAEKIAAASIGEVLSAALGADLKQSRFFEDFRAVPAAQARADLEAAEKRIAELEAALKPQWISVSERLPNDLQDVWINTVDDVGQPYIAFGFYYDDEDCFVDDQGEKFHMPSITHWMPATKPQAPTVPA